MNRGRGDFICAGFARAAAFTAPSCLAAGRKFTIAFLQGSSGIKADQGSAIELAPKHGFDWVEPFGPQLPEEGGARYVDVPIAAGLRWAAARLTVGIRADHLTFSGAGWRSCPPKRRP